MPRPLLMALLITTLAASAEAADITIVATTSVEDSGLFSHLIPKFERRTALTARVMSRPSTSALIAAEHGNVDVVIVNDAAAVDRFLAKGAGSHRRKLMSNDFVIVGPIADPAGIRDMKNAAQALQQIARLRAPYLSRGDESGTHAAEQRIWKAAGVNPKTRSGTWFRESGIGMGATLELASRSGAYIMTDRATWLAHQKGTLQVMVEGDPRLFNQYEVILAWPQELRAASSSASAFIDWLMSPDGQRAIAEFKIDGQQAFYPAMVPVN